MLARIDDGLGARYSNYKDFNRFLPFNMQSIVLDLGRTPFLLYANTFLWMSQTKLCLAEIKHSQASFFLKRKPLKKSLVLSL